MLDQKQQQQQQQQQQSKLSPTSPRKFLRALNSSPFRSGSQIQPRSKTNAASVELPTGDIDFDASSAFKNHGRSQSHDIANLNWKKSDPTNWTQLIPPLPTPPGAISRSSSSSNINMNRHTIAISPDAIVSVPDMLQPSNNPEREKSFVIRKESNKKGSSPSWASPFMSFEKPNPMPDSKPAPTSTQEKKPFQTPLLEQRQNSISNPSSSFSSSEKLTSSSRFPGQPPSGLDQGNPFWSEGRSRSTQRPRSNSRNFKNAQTNLPPQTPPPKLASMAPIPPPKQTHYPPQISGEAHSEPSISISKFAPIPPGPPPLIAQHSQQALTMIQSQDSLTSSGSNEQVSQAQKGKQAPRTLQTQQNLQNIEPHSQNQKSRRSNGKKRKSCNSCHQVINGQFVRALNNAYHIDCFKCYNCGVLCSSKFFPHEVTADDGSVYQVPLCEYDYFKKLGLICFTCDSALRGPYITALGNKYHLEHFKCHACGKVFESDESYYEHENSVYCHFHYSRLFATKCEGCHSSIVKQFVELFKGGKVQQWHPECYMVYKFWNVSVTIDSVGLPDSCSTDNNSLTSNELTAKDLVLTEQRIENTVVNCWVVLSGFEESSASCISEMLLSACAGKRMTGLLITGKLVCHLEVLFRALDYVQIMCLDFKSDNVSVSESKKALLDEVYSVDAFDKFQALRKEPRNISGKLMSYLAILRKSHNISESGSLSSELLAVITGCAHYLKLLIRIGLNNALTLNKLRGDTRALDGFLQLVRRYEEVEDAEKATGDLKRAIGSRLSVPHNATDACCVCSKSIEKSCILFSGLRWHNRCFECSKCQRKPSYDYKVESFLCGPNEKILCTDCAMSDNASGMGYTSGFTRVSDLSQLMYLLKIALSRSKSAIKKDTASNGSTDYLKPNAAMSHIEEEPSETETTYSKTLDEVTSLRHTRESQTLRNSIKKNARKSVILEAPQAATAKSDNTSNDADERTIVNRKGSSSSSISYTPSRLDSDHFDFHTNQVKIQDDPPQRMTSNSLDRTSDLLKNEKSLTLDDIPRIVAAEQAREQRPNAFKHHNSLYQKKSQQIKPASSNASPHEPAQMFFGSGENSDVKNKYFSELTKQEHAILRHISIEALLTISNQFSRDELLNLIQPKKQNTFWDKFRIGGGADKNKSMDVFGSDLRDVAKKYGVDSSSGVGPSKLRIPMLIEDITLALRQKDMSVEGIFRLNGNIKNLRELTEQINATPFKSPNFGNYSAVQLAALMKKWLRELPNPLLTFNLYDMWIASRREQNPVVAKRVLQLSYCLLPRSHRNLLEVLLYFFSWVASFAEIDEESGSKMDTHNLATVLAPNILLSKAASGENGENQSSDAHFLAIEVVNQLIEIHEDLAVIPNDLWQFYNMCQFNASAKTDFIPTKEIQSKISKISKENPEFFLEFARTDNCAEPSHQNTIKSGQAKVHDMVKSNR
ncbi:hypothetical protein JCM33374_g6196 [Metschnikowia sp. JCM 33374]|nr:hypothetical protein JCM33374_g6196 [Metschnikowia sp. JCM 33374]